MNLKNKKLWLFDMDGTIYKDSTLFDGTLPLLSKIKSIGGQAVFVTNNSSLSAKDYVEKLIRLGIDCTENDIFSSTHATALYINENFPKKRVFCVGTASMVQELKKFDVNAVTDTDGAEIVLLGFDTELTHKKLRDACVLLTGDIPYIATNPDYVCPTSFGSVPDCGSIAVMLEYAVKKKPLFIGKPSPVLIELAMKKL
ncbi:MAG: haloacid dehalogenase, partial [Clostridiales bacterium]|nr:haloacid dehalogenase [Clostridiales bacterium]